MRYLVAILMLVPSLAFAQSPPQMQSPSPELKFCQKAVTELQNQRNGADDRAAQVGAQLALLNEELTQERSKLASVQKELDELKKPKPDAADKK